MRNGWFSQNTEVFFYDAIPDASLLSYLFFFFFFFFSSLKKLIATTKDKQLKTD
jgi:hypothetical protein